MISMPPDLPDTPLDPLEAAKRAVDAKRNQKRASAPVLPTRLGTEFDPEATDWLWSERLPLGELSLIGGEPMEGKSTVLIGLMARISLGRRMPFDGVDREPADVIFYGPEEKTSKGALPRFIAAGGDRSRFIEILRTSSGPKMTFPSGAKLLDATLSDLRARGRNPRIIGIDGISTILDPLGPGGKPTSENVNADVERALEALLEVLRKHNIAAVGLRHLGKNPNVALNNRGLGAKKWEALARAEWVAVPHPDQAPKRALVCTKWTYAIGRPRSIIYDLIGEDVVLNNGTSRSFGVADFIEECDLKKEDLSGRPTPQKRTTKAEVGYARDAIAELLATERRAFTDAEVAEKLKDQSFSPAALISAAKELIQSKQASFYRRGTDKGIQPFGGALRAVPPPTDDEAPF